MRATNSIADTQHRRTAPPANTVLTAQQCAILRYLRDARQVDHGEVEHIGGVDAKVDALGRYALVLTREPVRLADYLLPDLGEVLEFLPREVQELPGVRARGKRNTNKQVHRVSRHTMYYSGSERGGSPFKCKNNNKHLAGKCQRLRVVHSTL